MFNERHERKILPLRTVPFNYEQFAQNNNKARMIRRNLPELPINGRAACYSLTKLWYELLCENKSLIHELGYGINTNATLIFKIATWQNKSKGGVIHDERLRGEEYDNMDMEKINSKNKTEKEYKKWLTQQYASESIFSDLDFRDATEQSSISGYNLFLMSVTSFDELDTSKLDKKPYLIKDNQGEYRMWGFKNNKWQLTAINKAIDLEWKEDQTVYISPQQDEVSKALKTAHFNNAHIETWLNRLDEFHHHQHGLHTITIADLTTLPPSKAHMMGWAFKNNEYILFDPNAGEMYFKDFKSFKHYLCEYVESIFPEWKEKQFLTNDYYSANDLTELEEIRRQFSVKPK